MSYTTNSTANRLKFNKGWKNPSFPEILPLYSRDNIFFFKLYLFLKAYFTLNRTKLIYCDLRTSENYTKILYLVINSMPKKLKKKNSFKKFNALKRTSGFKYSKMRNANFKYAVNLLYLDLPKLKKQVSAKLLPLSKQKVNPIFYRKTRYKTWINFLAKINNIRKTNNFKNIPFRPNTNKKLNIEQSFRFKLKRLKNEIIVLNRLFTTVPVTKQTVLIYKAQLSSLKKKFNKLVKILSTNKNIEVITQHRLHKTMKCLFKQKSLGINRSINIGDKKTLVTIIRKSTISDLNKNKISKNLLRARLFATTELLNANTKISLGNYKNWINRKLITCLKKTQLELRLKEQVSTRLLSRSLYFVKLRKSKIINLNNKGNTIILNDNLHKKFLVRTINAYISYLKENNSLNTQRSFVKFVSLLKAQQYISGQRISNIRRKQNPTVVFEKLGSIVALNYPTNLTMSNIVRAKRKKRRKVKFVFTLIKKLRQKKQLLSNARSFSKSSLDNAVNLKNMSNLVKDFEKSYKEITENLKADESNNLNVWKIRESFRHTYKKHASILTKYQYKLRLQQILFNYFKMNFEVKVVRPLVQFKNLKLLRLVHPLYNFNHSQHSNQSSSKDTIYKKTLRKTEISNANIIPLRRRYIVMNDTNKRFSVNDSYAKRNTYVFKKVSDSLQRQHNKELLEFTQSRLKEVRRKLMIRTFLPTVSLFIKYLNPQLLADHIAKEFEKSKYHQAMIYGLSQALQSLPFARAKGYRIAIVGRINSSEKSRSFLIKRNVLARQDFSRKINFASSQARARIGSFGIKVWIFY